MASAQPPAQSFPTILTSRPKLLGSARDVIEKVCLGARPAVQPLEDLNDKQLPVPLASASALPEAYSVPICVRNTFIDTSPKRSPSLERFYQEREVRTCPSSHIGRFSRLFEEADASRWVSDDDSDTQLPSENQETRSVSEASPSNAARTGPGCVLSLADALNPPTQPPQFLPACSTQLALASGLVSATAVVPEVLCASTIDWRQHSWQEGFPAQCVGTDGCYAQVLCDSPFGDAYFPWQPAALPQAPAAEGSFAGAIPAPVHHDGAFGDWHLPRQEATLPQAAAAEGSLMQAIPVDAQHAGGLVGGAHPNGLAPSHMGEAAPALATGAAAPTVLAPAPALPAEPAPGSEEMPSIGSAGHAVGGCKPCAFFHTVGCENGPTCQFCHLCAPDERKRRRKAKLEAFRMERLHRSGPRTAVSEPEEVVADF